MQQHDVRLTVGGTTFERCWTSFDVTHDVRRWPMDWRFTVAPATSQAAKDLRTKVANAAVVQVSVDGTTVATGRVVDTEIGGSRDKGTYLTISGAGALGPASRAAMPLGHTLRGKTIKDAVTDALAPWGVEVIGSNEANRSACTTRTIRDTTTTDGEQSTLVRTGGADSSVNVRVVAAGEARVLQVADDRTVIARPGETVADWLRRFLRDMHLVAWETARGQVFVGLPNYDAPALFTIVVPESLAVAEAVEGQVVSWKLIERPGDQATSVTVTGRVGRAGAVAISSTVSDDVAADSGWYSPRLVTGDKLRDDSQALARARQILRGEQLEAYGYEVTLAGHGVGRFLPAVDTMINVRDAIFGVSEPLWCAARTFSYSRDQGAQVRLTLVRPDLWGADAE